MGKAQLIADFQQTRQSFLSAIEGLSDDEMLQPYAVGYWSVKDVMAHLTAWESELVTALSRIHNRNKRMPHVVAIEDIDEWNEEQYHISASRSLQVVRDDFYGVGKYLVEAIENLDNHTLDDNRIFPWMEGEPLSYLIYENAIWHEEEHAQDIRAWREGKTADDMEEESET